MHRIDLFRISHYHSEDGSPEIVQSELVSKIREFHTSDSSRLTTKLLYGKMQDGRPAFNFMDLRRLSVHLTIEDEPNIQYLLQNAKLLEELHLSVVFGHGLKRLRDALSYSARTLKVLGLSVSFYDLLGGLCEELEAMTGHNRLEALSFEVYVKANVAADFIGSSIQKVEKVLVKPGWSSLRQVSIKVLIMHCHGFVTKEGGEKLFEVLQSLPDKYLSQLSKLDSVAFNYSVRFS